MKQKVGIIIEGIQNQDKKVPVITKAEGTYQSRNGKHYIRYEEISEENGTRMKNTLKLSPEQVIMKKDGPGVHTRLVFDRAEITTAIYQAPYGSLSFQISNSVIILLEEEDELRLSLKYTLSDQGGVLSDNQVNIRVTPLL